MSHSAPKTAQPKQTAVVDDSLYPMPRAALAVRDILDQIGASPNVALKRDYNGPHDQVFADDEIVHLTVGNVFTTIPKCAPRPCLHPSAKPKLAFVLSVEDVWEITVNPNQTGKTLKRLLGIGSESTLYRDLESPNDIQISDDESVKFSDGPVFIVKSFSLTIKVNSNPVKMQKQKATALEVKEAAIAQGVKIGLDFILFRLDADGNIGPALPDNKVLKLSDCDEFRCVAQDDNS